jgi:TIR domain
MSLPASYDVFISYARADSRPDARGLHWVEALRDRLVEDFESYGRPLRVFLDTDEIASMDDWGRRILVGLRQSKVLLCCLSPSYFASRYCRMEFDEYLARQTQVAVGDDTIAAVYFVQVPDTMPADIRAWRERVLAAQHVDLLEWFPNGAASLELDEVRERVRLLGSQLWERISRAHQAASVEGNIPPLNPFFIGRTEELRELHKVLEAGRIGDIAVVHGLGGMGKSELVVQYAHAFRDRYPAGVWRVNAEGKHEILTALAALSTEPKLGLHLDEDHRSDPEQIGLWALGELRSRAEKIGGPVLLLLDNVSVAQLLSAEQQAILGPDADLAVAVTTRLGPSDFPANRTGLSYVAVGELSDQDALRLIREHQGGEPPAFASVEEEQAALELVSEFDGFTLAIEQAAVFLGLPGAPSIVQLLDDLRELGVAELSETLGSQDAVRSGSRHREKQIGIVLDQTVDDLSTISPAAVTTLRVGALFPPDEVPWEWIRGLVAALHPEIEERKPGTVDPWADVRHRLEGRRLLSITDTPHIARMHRLVRQHLLDDLPTGYLESFWELLSNANYDLHQAERNPETTPWSTSEYTLYAHTLLDDICNQPAKVEIATNALSLLERYVVDGSVLEIARNVLEYRRLAADAQHDDIDTQCDLLEIINSTCRLLSREDPEQAIALAEEGLVLARSVLTAERQGVFGRKQRAIKVRIEEEALTAIGGIAEMLRFRDPARSLALWEENVAIARQAVARRPKDLLAKRSLAEGLEYLAREVAREDRERAAVIDTECLILKSQLLWEDYGDDLLENPLFASDARAIIAGLINRDPDTALEMQVALLSVTRAQAEAHPDNVQVQGEFLQDLDLLAAAVIDCEPERAAELLQESLEGARHLAEMQPGDIRAERNLGISLSNLSGALADRDPMQAALYAEEALVHQRKIQEIQPESLDGRRELAATLKTLGMLFAEADPLKAAGHLGELVEIRRSEFEFNRRVDEAKELASALENFARVIRVVDAEATRELLEEAVVLHRGCEEVTEDVSAKLDLALALRSVAEIFFSDQMESGGEGVLQDVQRALELYGEALDVVQALVATASNDRAVQTILVETLWGVAVIADRIEAADLRRNRWGAVYEAFRRLEEFGPLNDVEAERYEEARERSSGP